VGEIEVQVVRKAIKNLNLTVYPPHGRVRLSVPLFASSDQIHRVVISRLEWIRKKQALFLAQPQMIPEKMINGESHSIFGAPHILEVVERRGRHEVVLENDTHIQLCVNPGTTLVNRQKVLNNWYREQLKNRIPGLFEQWQSVIGVEVVDWGIKKMKTRWGSCNITHKRVWFNLELAKRPLECLEYVVVHELVHLRERYHDEAFYALLDRHLPNWQVSRAKLRQTPIT